MSGRGPGAVRSARARAWKRLVNALHDPSAALGEGRQRVPGSNNPAREGKCSACGTEKWGASKGVKSGVFRETCSAGST